MNELYLLNGIILIGTGVILSAYHIYASGKMSKALKFNKAMLSEAVGFITLGGFYIYCCFFLDPMMTNEPTNEPIKRDLNILEEFENLLRNFSKNHLENNLKLIFGNDKKCDFKLVWMEYSSFIGSFAHTLISLINTFFANIDDIKTIEKESTSRQAESSEKTKTIKTYLMMFVQWLTPFLAILLFYMGKNTMVSETKRPFRRPNPSKNVTTAVNRTEIQVINKVYKIVNDEIELMSFVSKTDLSKCFLNTNYLKLYMLNVLFVVYLIPVFVFTVAYLHQSYKTSNQNSKLTRENLQMSKSSFVWALILQSPAFFNTFFNVFLNNELKSQDKLTEILICLANLYSLVRLKQNIKLDNMKMGALYSVQPDDNVN